MRVKLIAAISVIILVASIYAATASLVPQNSNVEIYGIVKAQVSYKAADYIIFKDGSYTCLLDGRSGSLQWRSLSTSAILQAALGNLTNGGKILFSTDNYVIDSNIIVDEPTHGYYCWGFDGAVTIDFSESAVTFNGSLMITNKPARLNILNLVVEQVNAPILYTRAGNASYSLYRSLIQNVHVKDSPATAVAFDLGDITENMFQEISAQQMANYEIFKIGAYKDNMATNNQGINTFQRVFVTRWGDYDKGIYHLANGGHENINNMFIQCQHHDQGTYNNPAWIIETSFRSSWYSCVGNMNFIYSDECSIYDHQYGTILLQSGTLNVIGGRVSVNVQGGKMLLGQAIVDNVNVAAGAVLVMDPAVEPYGTVSIQGGLGSNSGIATGTSPIYVKHNLAGWPQTVQVTPNTDKPCSVSYTVNATYITIYHNAGTSISVSWNAKCDP
jgi:hypothetical protein